MDDSTKNLIQSHIDTNEVCLFMKGTPMLLSVDFLWLYQIC